MENSSIYQQKGNLLNQFYPSIYHRWIRLFASIILIFLLPIGLYIYITKGQWILVSLFATVLVCSVIDIVTFRIEKGLYHIDLYENGVWYPFPLYKLYFQNPRFSGFFIPFNDVHNIEAIPFDKNDVIVNFHTSSEINKIAFPVREKENFVKQIENAWRRYNNKAI